MITISSIFKASAIAETYNLSEQLSIVYSVSLRLKHLSFFISRDISASEFLDIGFIVSWNVLDRHKKLSLLDKIRAWKKLVIVFKQLLATVCIIV